MTQTALPACVRRVHSFAELVSTPFCGQTNALCWERALPGDFAEVAAQLGAKGAGIEQLTGERLRKLSLSPAGAQAVDIMLADLGRLRDHGLEPELNCIRQYPRDDAAAVVPVDVYSFHADSAPVETDTWLCTYHGATSEGLPNTMARRRTEIPATRAALLAAFGGDDGSDFAEYLSENCFDLHYAPLPGAESYSFGLGHLWRIAVDWPGNPGLPCIHRAPLESATNAPRLTLIS